jgi:hypothetical protein
VSKRLLTFLFLSLVVAITGGNWASTVAATGPTVPDPDVVAKFWWWTPEIAIASGFETDGECVEVPELGGMGVHYVKMAHVDGTFNKLEPEVLLFDPQTNKLMAVEYIIVSSTRPWAFGQPFAPLSPEAGIEGAWALHMWLIENPSGQLAPFNPNVSCGPPKPRLPEGTIQLSPLVPAMGEHWANPADLPKGGPVWLVYQGKVIGVEYVVPVASLSKTVEATQLEVGRSVNHMDLAFMAEGHPPELPSPHVEVHLYFISPEEKAAIK